MRLALVCSHPIQYYAPWFAHITANTGWDVRVFYLWDGRTSNGKDREFDREVQWGRQLDNGIVAEFVRNEAKDPGTHHFFGLVNPQLERQLDEFAPDVLFLHCYNYRSVLPLLIRKSASVPVLLRGDTFTARTNGAVTSAKRVVKSMLFKRCAGLLCVGKRNRDYYLNLGLPEERLFPVPHCVDNEWFAGPSQRESGKVEFVFVGKFIDRKRPLDLVRALNGWQEENVRLRFIGAGELEPQLREAAAKDPRIEVAGFRDQADLPAEYRRADYVVLPSDWETWGLCINEGMAAGCGAIVSDSCGCAADLVVPGWNGFIHRTGDVGSIRRALVEAVQLVREGEPIEQRSRELIAGYSFERATEGLRKAVESILATRETRR